jgi:PhnB protein
MQTHTHLHFNGNCAEAFRFYARALNGHIAFALTYGESPAAKHTPAEAHQQIIHTRLEFGDQALCGCDTLGHYQPPQGFNVILELQDPAEAERLFNTLAEGGRVVMPCAETFWARRFGMCTDRFGTPWIVNCAKPEEAVEAARRRA